MVETLCESAVEVGAQMIQAANNQPQWRQVAKQMLHAWNDGMMSLRSSKGDKQLRGLDAAIAAAGFSEATPAEKAAPRLAARSCWPCVTSPDPSSDHDLLAMPCAPRQGKDHCPPSTVTCLMP